MMIRIFCKYWRLVSLLSVTFLVFCLSSCLILSLSSCGFHLRGQAPIPSFLKLLRITPHQPFDPFQRALRFQFKTLGGVIVQPCLDDNNFATLPLLTILHQNFIERTTAFGPDVQVNRALLEFEMAYQITDAKGQIIVPPSNVLVQRELMINPNAVLGTEYERNRVQEELYIDAALQLCRQLSRSPRDQNANSNP